MSTREFCELKFRTSLGKIKTINVNDPRPALIPSNITGVGIALCAIELFDETVGRLETFVGAKHVNRTTTVII
jgi:hypothetical protein